MNRREQIARVAHHAATEAALRDALFALRDAGVEVMPLKGVLLRRVAYDDPVERTVGDIDLLVRGRDVRAAHDALAGAGFAPMFLEFGERQRCFRHPRHKVLIDLHWQLFYQDYFDLDAEGLFARSTRDARGFATPVARMSPLDLYAHVLVHAGFASWSVESPRLDDIPRVAERLAIDPAAAAAHLRAHGMDGFARYALRLVLRAPAQAHAARVLAALGEDRRADLVARAALAVMPRLRGRPYLAYAPRRMLYRSGEEVVANAAILAARAARWVGRRVGFAPPPR